VPPEGPTGAVRVKEAVRFSANPPTMEDGLTVTVGRFGVTVMVAVVSRLADQ